MSGPLGHCGPNGGVCDLIILLALLRLHWYSTMRLTNPFTPSEIASTPDLFYGRVGELRQIERSLPIGSVLIQGPMGIGKSSLLARAMDLMTGFGSDHRGEQVTVVVDRDVTTVDETARLVLDAFGATVRDDGKNSHSNWVYQLALANSALRSAATWFKTSTRAGILRCLNI